jgi:hypothetical protein
MRRRNFIELLGSAASWGFDLIWSLERSLVRNGGRP